MIVTHCMLVLPPRFEGVQAALVNLRASLTQAEVLWLDAPKGHPVYGDGGEQAGAVLPGTLRTVGS